MPPPRTCECGDCQKCKQRAYSYEYYRRNAQKVREISLRSRARRIEAVREAARKRKPQRDPMKVRAMNAVSHAVRYGYLDRQPCEVCGETTVEGHHEDYARPLDVRWLCKKHHMELHRSVAA